MAIDPFEFAQWLTSHETGSAQLQTALGDEVSQLDWTAQQWCDWFSAMASLPVPLNTSKQGIAEAAVRCAIDVLQADPQAWELDLVSAISAWYHQLPPESAIRPLLLALLAAGGARESLEAFASLVLHQPPASASAVGIAFQPLFRTPDAALQLYPRLLDALPHPSVAAAILDLSNYLVRSGAARVHPAADRHAALVELLGQLVRRLEQLEEQPVETSSEFQDVSRQVAEATSVAISLCDAVALMDARDAIAKLYPLLEVRHRRLQVEAAAALARLEDETGKQKLLDLAAEPVVRLYAVQFAAELELLDQIPDEFRSKDALAVAKAALFLSQPTQFGVPPADLQVIDRRRLPWPGYDEPTEAVLVRYSYSTEQGEWSNIACVGPDIGVCMADLCDLAPDDIYAVFAGLETAHEEIRHWETSEWTTHHLAEVARLERQWRDRGYVNVKPRLLACFFGDWLLVAGADREGIGGIGVIDSHGVRWFPTTGSRPLDTAELFALYKGRRLLQAFGLDPETGGQSGSDGI